MTALQGYAENRRTVNAIGQPIQMMWMIIPIAVILSENRPLFAAERGTTTHLMKKYTAIPYSTPEAAGFRIKNESFWLAAK